MTHTESEETMDRSRIVPAALSQPACSRRRLLQGSAALSAAALLGAPRIGRAQAKSPLAGKSIHMSILGIAGWAAEQHGRGYVAGLRQIREGTLSAIDVTFFVRRGAVQPSLFQKAATSLATRGARNTTSSSPDSQWLGALATSEMDPGRSTTSSPSTGRTVQPAGMRIRWRTSYQVSPRRQRPVSWGLPGGRRRASGSYVRKDILVRPPARR